MDRDDRWFPRLMSVPGVDYQSPAGLDRIRLPGYDAQPTVRTTYLLDDSSASRRYLLWPSAVGETSASPAQAWAGDSRPDVSEARAALFQLYEALELPGTLNDYHFRLQGCCAILWRARLTEPELLAEVERLCLTDLQLIEIYPDIITPVGQGSGSLHVSTCDQLISLYEHEGMLHEALAIAERGQRLNQDTMIRAVTRLRERVVSLEAETEDAGHG